MTQNIPKISTSTCCVLLLVLLSDPGDAIGGDPSPGVSSTGLSGAHKVGMPSLSSPQINLAGTAGYGLTESLGSFQGPHHRLFGRLALGAHVAPWLGLALQLDGRYDTHPPDDEGKDSGGAGQPRLVVRAGTALGELFHIGGEIELWVPGDDAPSMAWNATTVDLKLLSALSPHDRPWFVGLLTGFRADRSAKAAPPVDRLRQGDRIALGLSDYNSVLLGLAGTYRWDRVELLAELSWDVLVGEGAPPAIQSPMRADLGARYAIFDALFAELLTEVALSKRPGVGPDAALVPIDPRFSVSFGLRYVFDLGDDGAKEAAPVEEPPEELQAPAPSATTVSGILLDPTGAPVADADVSLRAEDGTDRNARTDETGAFVFDDVPTGPATLTAHAWGLEQGVWEIQVGTDPIELGQRTLDPIEEEPPGSQLRGLVRSFSGKKLAAKVRVEPIGAELTCSDGTFQLDVPPGTYKVTVSARGFVSQTRKVIVEENGVSILNVDLRRR